MKQKQYFEPYIINDETLKKMKVKMLDLLLYYKEFCDKHELMFYLSGGGAIGALREQGFIPWDDDLDVLMPRHDYERFQKLWEKYGNKDRYVYCRSNKEVNFHHPAASLRDPSTTFICSYNVNSNICHGISLEMGPIDAAPNSKLLQYIQIFHGYTFALFNAQRLPNNRGNFLRKCTKIAYILIPSKKIQNAIWIKAEKKKSKYLWEKAKYVKELWGKTSFYNFPKEWFDKVVYFEFEGHQMPLMKGYHEYLTIIFGDYMKRPPISERVAKHELVYVNMDHPYTDYKGIYYFPDKSGKK